MTCDKKMGQTYTVRVGPSFPDRIRSLGVRISHFSEQLLSGGLLLRFDDAFVLEIFAKLVIVPPDRNKNGR